MFLDTSGAGGPPTRDDRRRRDEEPEKPASPKNAELAWLLGFLATLIFCTTIAIGSYLTGQMIMSFVLLSLLATTGVFCTFTWIMYGDRIANVVREKRKRY